MSTTMKNSSNVAKTYLKRLERMEKIDRPILDRKRMGLEITGWRGSSKVLEIQDLDKSFQTSSDKDSIIFSGLETIIWRDERVGLVGPNGSGKSLLFKMILGEDQPNSGNINHRPKRQDRILCPGTSNP